MIVRVSSKIAPPQELIHKLGADEQGRVQAFFTARVLFHMRAYMPWRSGETASALTTQTTPAQITVNAPYARYLYAGKKMYDPNGGGPFPIKDELGEFDGEFRYRRGSHPIASERPLTYTHTHNPQAGPHWDRIMVQAVGDQIRKEVQEYIDKQAR